MCDPALTEPLECTELVSLDELLERSDVVSLHVPLLEQTRGLIGARELGLMKPTAVLVNASRGNIVDEAALEGALRSGAIRAAALDVFSDEPPFDSALLALPNMILTPHVGGISHRAIRAMTEMATASVLGVLRGQMPAVVINPEVLK